MEEENPLLGTWLKVSSSTKAQVVGFEHLDREEEPVTSTTLFENRYTFLDDGSFGKSVTVWGEYSYKSSGTWSLEGDKLILETTEPMDLPDDFEEGLSHYFRNSKLREEQVSMFRGFSNQQITEFLDSGILGPDGFTVDRDSLDACCAMDVPVITTSKFEKQ